MSERSSRERRREMLRFAAVGASNTGSTLAVFVVLTFFMPAPYAYTIAFSLGLLYTTLMSSRFVYRVDAMLKGHVRFVGWYLFVFVVGLGIVSLLDWVGAPRMALVAGAAAVTVPLNYLGGRMAFSSASSAAAGDAASVGVELPAQRSLGR